MKLQGKRGAGAFQWNRGGWFGSQVGATLWLVLLGAVLLPQSMTAGGAVLALGIAANLVGIALWRRRETLSPYPAIQILLAVCGVAALIGMLTAAAFGLTTGSTRSPSAWFLLLYPGLMLSFHLQERSARKAAA